MPTCSESLGTVRAYFKVGEDFITSRSLVVTKSEQLYSECVISEAYVRARCCETASLMFIDPIKASDGSRIA